MQSFFFKYIVDYLIFVLISFFAGYKNKTKPQAHPVKIDLNKKLDPRQNSIHSFNIDAQRFRKTKKENPPTQEIRVAS